LGKKFVCLTIAIVERKTTGASFTCSESWSFVFRVVVDKTKPLYEKLSHPC
jgi:hypothetical protein